MESDEDGSESLQDIFTDPWRPPTPEATFARYISHKSEHNSKDSPRVASSLGTLSVRSRVYALPLFYTRRSWNASVAVAEYLESNCHLVRGRFVLELGAGGGLPGIVSAQIGAEMLEVVLTDYPDRELINNLTTKVDVQVTPFRFLTLLGITLNRPRDTSGGTRYTDLLAALPSTRESWRAFDLIILSDLVFNHSQASCRRALLHIFLISPPSKQPAPCVLVFFTHHRPHLADRDLDFFNKARAQGWVCEKIVTRKFPPMFPDDPGDEEVRSTVYGWRLVRGFSKAEATTT
ncbi:hypothetical protein EDD15DRAFT_2507960 [Pisolithus albus]|nr:hypothetical protein EDD15DRAFT_2507960 [Pisolithus albus]